MKIYAMSDLHGCYTEFDYALSMVEPHLNKSDTKLILLGDYIHGPDSYAVLDRIITLQDKWGTEKVIALCGNHELMAMEGRWPIGQQRSYQQEYYDDKDDDRYLNWMRHLPFYHVEGKTIFVHAGIDEEAEDMWEWGTDEYIFAWKFPAQTGHFYGDWKIVAGHVGTGEISGDPYNHDIYFDGKSHYYIDGSVLRSGVIPVIMVDTDTNKYYRVENENSRWLILPYDEENG